MAFSTPTFNLFCQVYTGPWPVASPRIPFLPCNLANGRRVDAAGVIAGFPPQDLAGPTLLVPAGSDVRDVACGDNPDLIQCPPSSGRWYFVLFVDDVAKGFPNEYRLVRVCKAWQGLDPAEFPGLFWPTPIP